MKQNSHPSLYSWVAWRAILLSVPTIKLLGPLTDGWSLPPEGTCDFVWHKHKHVLWEPLPFLHLMTALQSGVCWHLSIQLKHLPNLGNNFLRSAMLVNFLQSSGEWVPSQNNHFLSSSFVVNNALEEQVPLLPSLNPNSVLHPTMVLTRFYLDQECLQHVAQCSHSAQLALAISKWLLFCIVIFSHCMIVFFFYCNIFWARKKDCCYCCCVCTPNTLFLAWWLAE